MLGNFAKESGDTFRHDVVQGEIFGGTPIVYTKEDIDEGVINKATGELKTDADIGRPKKGYGIAQFDFMNDFYQDFITYNDKEDSLDSQLDYINDVIRGTDQGKYSKFTGRMLNNNDRKELAKVLAEGSVEETTKAFMDLFETPRDYLNFKEDPNNEKYIKAYENNLGSRTSSAKNMLEEFEQGLFENE